MQRQPQTGATREWCSVSAELRRTTAARISHRNSTLRSPTLIFRALRSYLYDSGDVFSHVRPSDLFADLEVVLTHLIKLSVCTRAVTDGVSVLGCRALRDASSGTNSVWLPARSKSRIQLACSCTEFESMLGVRLDNSTWCHLFFEVRGLDYDALDSGCFSTTRSCDDLIPSHVGRVRDGNPNTRSIDTCLMRNTFLQQRSGEARCR